MRIAVFGLIAATAVLCSACTPAVGSKEWCDGLKSGSIKPNENDAAQVQAAVACVMGGVGDAMKQMMQGAPAPGQ